MELRLIRDTSELKGTCYFEFLPRKYDGRCWNPDSVYVDEEVVYLFDVLLARHIPNYDHFSFTELNSEAAERLANDLIAYAQEADKAESPQTLLAKYKVPDWAMSEIDKGWPQSKTQLSEMLSELGSWFKNQAPHAGLVSVLGI